MASGAKALADHGTDTFRARASQRRSSPCSSSSPAGGNIAVHALLPPLGGPRDLLLGDLFLLYIHCSSTSRCGLPPLGDVLAAPRARLPLRLAALLPDLLSRIGRHALALPRRCAALGREVAAARLGTESLASPLAEEGEAAASRCAPNGATRSHVRYGREVAVPACAPHRYLLVISPRTRRPKGRTHARAPHRGTNYLPH